VRRRDEWDWLRHLLSVDTIKRLLADEYDGKKKIVSVTANVEISRAALWDVLLTPSPCRIASSCAICMPCTSFCMTIWIAA